MSLGQRAKEELKAVGAAALYFGCWIGSLLLLKTLLLAEYHIAFSRWSTVVVGALILSKVVLVLEHVPLGAWVDARPAWVDLLLRTALYALGLVVVLVLEKGFETRHEHGGFVPAVIEGFSRADAPHVLVNAICLSGALLGFNVLAVMRRSLGTGGLTRIFSSPLPAPTESSGPPV